MDTAAQLKITLSPFPLYSIARVTEVVRIYRTSCITVGSPDGVSDEREAWISFHPSQPKCLRERRRIAKACSEKGRSGLDSRLFVQSSPETYMDFTLIFDTICIPSLRSYYSRVLIVQLNYYRLRRCCLCWPLEKGRGRRQGVTAPQENYTACWISSCRK